MTVGQQHVAVPEYQLPQSRKLAALEHTPDPLGGLVGQAKAYKYGHGRSTRRIRKSRQSLQNEVSEVSVAR
jgi:hypothetical protein